MIARNTVRYSIASIVICGSRQTELEPGFTGITSAVVLKFFAFAARVSMYAGKWMLSFDTLIRRSNRLPKTALLKRKKQSKNNDTSTINRFFANKDGELYAEW